MMFPIHKGGVRTDPNSYNPIHLTRYFESIWNCHLQPNAFVYQAQRTTDSTPLRCPVSAFNRRSTDPRLTLLVDFTRWPRKYTPGVSKFLCISIKFGTKAFCRNYQLSDFPRLLSGASSFPSKLTISIRVDGILSQPFPVNAGIPQGSILAPINGLLSNISTSIHSFADDASFHCFSNRTPRYANTKVHRDRYFAFIYLSFDFDHISSWTSNNHVTFNASETPVLLVF